MICVTTEVIFLLHLNGIHMMKGKLPDNLRIVSLVCGEPYLGSDAVPQIDYCPSYNWQEASICDWR